MGYRNIGTINGGVIGMGGQQRSSSLARFNDSRRVRSFKDSAIASGGAFLVSELEKRDPKIRQPLTSFTYPRDIPLKVGGGWVEYITAMNIDFGSTGGSGGAVSAPGANGMPVIQMNMEKDTFTTHVFSTMLRIGFIDMQRSQITGKSLDALLTDGVRVAYDKHMDANVYVGISEYGTQGLLNNSNVIATDVAPVTAEGSDTQWAGKTPAQILEDVNKAINDVWEASGYDLAAIPNHILIPPAQFNRIATQPVSGMADKSILTYLEENNIARMNGRELTICSCPWCKGAGVGGKDRMVVYVHDERYLAEEELVPLSRTMTSQNPTTFSYDSVYTANISQVEFFYTQTIRYYDGI